MNAEILKAAGEAAPELLEKVAKALFVLEHIDPEFAEDLTAELSTITEYTSEKVSATDLGGPKAWALGVAGMVGAGLAGAVATDLYDAAKRGLTKGMNFKRIMEANPDIKRNFDQKDIKKSYDTFHRYAPDFTSDPNLGGQILKAMVEIPENQHQLVKDLLNSRKNLRDIKKGQYSSMNAPYIPASVLDDMDDKRVERMAWLKRQPEAQKSALRDVMGRGSSDFDAHERDQHEQRSVQDRIAREAAADAVRAVPNRFVPPKKP